MKYNKKLADYVNANYDIRVLYKRVMHRDPGSGKCFCPFHNNVNTPAAKVYDNSLKCFGVCNRMFSVFDFMNRFFPEELQEIAKSVVLPEVEQRNVKFAFIHRENLDLSKPLEEVIKEVVEYEKG